jgi:AraC-like DNA-binding protein
MKPGSERKAGPVSFHTTTHEGGEIFEPKRLPWCKVGYAVTGVIEASVEGQRFLCPPHYATWIPANALHSCHTMQNVKFVSIHIQPELCAAMPGSACTLALSPLIKAILADFAARDIAVPEADEDVRLAMVLVDQLKKAPQRPSYLPVSDDVMVRAVTDGLRENPRSRRSLAQWAEILDTTERTLSRRFQGCLDLSFNEWRQRMKLVAALSMIEEGKNVQEISGDLGYNSPSAFIAMFRRQTGASPTHLPFSSG